MSDRYNHKVAEPKWQKRWQDANIFKVEKKDNKKKSDRRKTSQNSKKKFLFKKKDNKKKYFKRYCLCSIYF